MLSERPVMWQPNERLLTKYHLAGSIATLVCGAGVFFICLAPAFFPDCYRFLVDERIALVIPYLMFIALAEAIFSIWYFLIRR
jgi:hypothetical protein